MRDTQNVSTSCVQPPPLSTATPLPQHILGKINGTVI